MKMQLKSLWAVVICVALVFSLAACNNQKREEEQSVGDSSQDLSPSESGEEGESAQESGQNDVEPEPLSAPQGGDYDVVVVGGGLAGISAAISSAEAGASVVLVEKQAFLGGNSILATGVFYAGGTEVQAAEGMEDTADAFYEDAMEASENRRDPVQTRMVADRGAEMISWLQGMGVEFDPHVTPAMGSTIARAHQALPDSAGYLGVMREAAESKGVVIQTGTPVTQINVDDNDVVTGVTAQSGSGEMLEYNAKSVILACGGFGADKDRLERFTPNAKGILYAGSPGTTGELIEQAIDMGADTVDLDIPWLTPTVEYEKNQLITSMVLSKGGILVNEQGQRFTDETASYFETGSELLTLGVPYIYEIWDDQVRENGYKVEEYVNSGLAMKVDTLEELAEAIGCDVEALQATIDTYNASVANPASDPFGRTVYNTEFSQAPYYYAKVMTGTIMTPGGLKIDEECRVVKTDGSTIQGLFATGESTGGYRAYGYIAGDSLTHAAVSGMVAGKAAAQNK